MSELHDGVHISNKEVAVQPNFAIHNVKTRFSFLYRSLNTKTSTIASNRNFKSCLSICCLAPQHNFRFLHVCRGLSFALATLLLIVSPSSTLHRAIENLWSIVIDARRCSCPSVCGFRRRDDLLAWGVVVREPLWAKISNLILGGIRQIWAKL